MMLNPDPDPYVPPEALEAFRLYVMSGIETGACLRAALENNMMEFFGRSAEPYQEAAFGIASYIHNEIPNHSWGSQEIVSKWIASGGLEGQAAKRD